MRFASLMLPVFALLLIAAQDGIKQDPPTCVDCKQETYGTTIQWEGSVKDAAKKAKDEKKLVFVLHVSGNFEDPKFT